MRRILSAPGVFGGAQAVPECSAPWPGGTHISLHPFAPTTLLVAARVKEKSLGPCGGSVSRAPLVVLSSLPGERIIMKSKYLAAIPLAALTLGAAFGISESRVAQAQGGAVHIRAVDLDAIIQKSSGAKAILGDFQKFQKSKQQELQKEQASLEQAQRQLGPNASQEQMQAYGQRVQAISRKLQDAEVEAQQRFAATQQKVIQELAPSFKSYARDNGVGMLVDGKSGSVLYVDPAWDATQEVVKRLK